MQHQEYKNVADLITKRSWTAGEGIDSAANYSGPSYDGFVVGLSRSRDSATLPESNFESLLVALGGVSNSVRVVRFGHWGCGWFEQIHVSVRAPAKLKILMECLNALADYPVLDDSDYSEREQAEQADNLTYYGSDWAKETAKVLEYESDWHGESAETLREAREEWASHPDMLGAVSAIYAEDCAYRGVHDAWVSTEAVRRWISSEGKCYRGMNGVLLTLIAKNGGLVK